MKKYFMIFLFLCTLPVSNVWANAQYTVSGTVNVNTATKQQIMLVPGIGEAKADAIIERRSQKPFIAVDDLLVIKGIGEKILAKISGYISVKGESTIQRVKQPEQKAPLVSKK